MSSPETNDLATVVEALRSHDRFFLTTHENPDGDALGSLLATKLALDQLGKDDVMVLYGDAPLPGEYAFMELGGLLRRWPDDAAERVLVALDCANESRIADPEILGRVRRAHRLGRRGRGRAVPRGDQRLPARGRGRRDGGADPRAAAKAARRAPAAREPPRERRRAGRVGDRAQVGRRRAPPGGGVLERRDDRRDHRVRPARVPRGPRAARGIAVVPRGLSPAGLVLVDKPAGPSSFAIVRELRDRTGARAGHAGTLDPFATGLLLVLLGRATKLASRFVGLDKRYVTDVDLSAVSSTGDPEGELDPREPPAREELEAALERLRGEVELPVPAYSAVKVGGQRAYRLARRGEEDEVPVRRSGVHELELLDDDDRVG